MCALAFLAGAAAAVVLNYPPGSDAGAQGVTAKTAVPQTVSAAEIETAADRAAEGAPAEETAPQDDGVNPAEASVRSSHADGEAGGARRRSDGVRGRATADGRSGSGSRATRSHTRGSEGRLAAGGQAVAGRTVGGVKKTGAGMKKAGTAVGRTLGKIGGVFHD